MEAATLTPAAVEQPTTEPAAAQPRKSLFKWSEWVHVGDGAEECEKRTSGCTDPNHFHAWVRLPNPYQARDILEKARAARARRMRTLRDPDSDARAVLEDDLDAIRASNAKEILIDEMLAAQAQEILVEATREVMDYDAEPTEESDDEGEGDGETPKKYGLIDQDMEELARLEALPEDERGEDYDTLRKRVEQYRADVNAAEERITAPRRQVLQEKSWDELIDMVRKERMEEDASNAYLTAFQLWQWFACTFKAPKAEVRVFDDFTRMRLHTPTDVMEALRLTFNDLESRMSRSRAGNS